MKTPEEQSALNELDAEIARLEAELADKRARKARESLIDQLSDLAGFFVCLVPDYSTGEDPELTNDQLAVAIEVLRAAKLKYDHRIAVLAAAPADRPQRLLPSAPASGEAPAVTFDGKGWTWTVRRPGAKAIQGAPFASEEEARADLERFLALNDGGAPFQASKSFRAAGTGSVRRNGNGYQWKLQRDGEALLSKTWPTREQAEIELVRVVADSSFVPEPRAVRADGKGASGKGSIQPAGNGFQWRLSRNGKVERSRTFATREEAEAELAQVIADPSFVPAPKDRERVAETSPHHCSRCGERGHRAPACSAPAVDPRAPAPAPPAAVQIPPPSVAPAQASNPAYIHPGRGWGPVDGDGRAAHELCKGTGQIQHNNGNGKTSRVVCKPCGGQGVKACLQKPAKGSAECRWS